MIDLEKTQTDRYWRQRDPRLFSILAAMDLLEPWVLEDHEMVADHLRRMLVKLEGALPSLMPDQRDRLVRLLAYLSAPSSIRLLEWLEAQQPGLTDDLLKISDEEAAPAAAAQAGSEKGGGENENEKGQPPNPWVEVLTNRLQTLRSVALLGRVFSEQRLGRVNDALQTTRTK